jgi:hypothetical protein
VVLRSWCRRPKVWKLQKLVELEAMSCRWAFNEAPYWHCKSLMAKVV